MDRLLTHERDTLARAWHGCTATREQPLKITGLYGASMGLAVAALAPADRSVVVVTADYRAADALRVDLGVFSSREPLLLRSWPRTEGRSPDADVVVSRARVLHTLHRRPEEDTPPALVVAPLAALVQPVPSANVFRAGLLQLTVGDDVVLQVLQEHLATAGFARVGAVSSPGEFASRGGILDVWPWERTDPLRIEFFGDEIESIRSLDAATQRSGDAVQTTTWCVLPPEQVRHPVGSSRASLPDHLGARDAVLMIEPEAIVGAATSYRSSEGLGADARVSELESKLAERPVTMLTQLPDHSGEVCAADIGTLDTIVGIALRAALRAEDRDADARAIRIVKAFQHVSESSKRLLIYRRAVGEEERLRELLAPLKLERRMTFVAGSISRSFVHRATGTAHIAYDDLADTPMRERLGAASRTAARPIRDFLELEVGGLVVHLHHGIGIFRGLDTIEGPDGTGQFFKVEFAEGTTVYVPVARVDLVQRYVGTGRRPKLSRLGGQEWTRRKKKVSEAVEDLAEELLEAQAARARRRGHAYPADGEWQEEFDAAFPHDDTPDQTAAVQAIKQDLEGMRPMDRLLCGDVGYGKTEVALRAIFKVIASGKQAAVLVPTKVLAQQHARVFQQRLAPYPLDIRVLSGLRTHRENRETIDGLKDGSVDVVIGTHRLLSKDVAFKDLGLVVVDEEQRFGVKHKERLKSYRPDVDLLTLSATPIPRTLHMALLGIRDISNLTTPPLGRHAIDTVVTRERDDVVQAAIRRELDRGGQVFLVNSRIKELPSVGSWLLRLVPELRLTKIHGQMAKKLVEDRLMRFVRGDVDMLLATTIIESGLDIPNANTIIVRDADRYGLADLHQLRGRVGRERRRAHALLLLPRGRSVRGEAQERLRAIEEYSELGAGFRIAMRDLEIRGAGNILGAKQSGHIASVGYELYCKLLADAVAHAKGKGTPKQVLAYLALDVPAGIPLDYVADRREQFHLFRRVSSVTTLEDLAELRQEFDDRFGDVPPDVDRLLLGQRARCELGALGVERIAPGPDDVSGLILHGSVQVMDRLRALLRAGRRLSPTSTFVPLAEPRDDTPPPADEMLRRILKRLRRAGDRQPRQRSRS